MSNYKLVGRLLQDELITPQEAIDLLVGLVKNEETVQPAPIYYVDGAYGPLRVNPEYFQVTTRDNEIVTAPEPGVINMQLGSNGMVDTHNFNYMYDNSIFTSDTQTKKHE